MELLERTKQQIVRANCALAWMELLVCQFLVVGFALLLLLNVMLRYVLSAPLYYAEETAIYMLIWMTYLAAASAIARGDMVALTIVTDKLQLPLQQMLKTLVNLLIAAMCVVLLNATVSWLNAPGTAFDRALTLGMPKRPFYAIMAIFFALTSFHALVHAFLGSMKLLRWDFETDTPDSGKLK
ncbi:TRAP transporter small permease [Sulfitobacter sp. KE34]|uniref:TRAP transporter small permease n=1 Tax=unclassified Sulfitobacter TaxID=196795 RepID=UPI0023E12550|nr:MULTISPECIES: TRAP transporter small permease [unclassified Sulfitobacter]MDF3352030.1 TRAP transporter small permease [Sulfitobacter sp. KE12]MDF3355719.1 TRAP transporter small permease [Sulfitobacter sp. KE27]MDF3359276.1 TRAP transporter small permease [Sulfitobacter sp. KE33]MDF3366660.1 TRAP transporter small permease [Sulfitobacter sp. Ks34]MDF3370400.1 TRAP transporter small permease [Sulfitobacter sp. Ks43]